MSLSKKLKSGVYRILNKSDGKFYIGSAIDIGRRWRQHKHELKNNKHSNSYLQNSWNKYGEDSFQFLVLEYLEIDKLQNSEQGWLDDTQCFNRDIGYNISPTAANITGYRHTEISKELSRQANLGKLKSEEHKINIGLGHRKLNKWPHTDGWKCKCDECHWKRYEMHVDYRRAKKAFNVQT